MEIGAPPAQMRGRWFVFFGENKRQRDCAKEGFAGRKKMERRAGR